MQARIRLPIPYSMDDWPRMEAWVYVRTCTYVQHHSLGLREPIKIIRVPPRRPVWKHWLGAVLSLSVAS